MKMKKIILFCTLMLCAGVSIQAQTAPWITGYVCLWWSGYVESSQLDLTGMTHVIAFPAQAALTSSPYFNKSSLDGAEAKALLTRAHSQGVKVLASAVGGYGEQNMPAVVSDAVKCSTFVVNACSFAKAQGYDGIELDWEFPRSSDAVGWNRLIRLFRQELDKWSPRGVFMTSLFYSNLGSPYVKDSMVAAFDQMLVMAYTMWMGTSSQTFKSGFDTPVNMPTQFSGYNGTALSASTTTPLTYLNAGYPANKMTILMSFNSTWFSGVTTMGQAYSGWGFGSVADDNPSPNFPSVPATGRQYDQTAKAAWCVSGSKVYSYLDTSAVKEIVSWSKSKGFNNGIYDISCGRSKKNGDYLVRAIVKAVNGGSVTPPPVPVPSLSVSQTSLLFGSVTVNTNSAEKSYTLTGSNLNPASGTITVTAPTGFYVTQNSGSGYNNFVTFSYTNSSVSKIIYTRFTPTQVQSYSGSIVNAGGGVTGVAVQVSGTGSPIVVPPPSNDTLLIWNNGYQSGVKSVNKDSIAVVNYNLGSTDGYDVGYEIGVKSVNVDSIFNAGKLAGEAEFKPFHFDGYTK